MSKKHPTHLRGERGQAFAERVRGVPLDRILCVSLDIGKYFHVAMIHNGLGEIITPIFEVDMFQRGYAMLCQEIEKAKARTQAQTVWVGMEPTSHYFENLARQLLNGGYAVTLENSFAVKQNRDQQMMQREKTDQIDAAAIGDLLRRGEGTPYRPLQGLYLRLQQLDRVRLSKLKIERMLKNQIIGHLDRIFPGLVVYGAEAKGRYQALFGSDFWDSQTLQHLIRVCPDPHQLAKMQPEELIQAFHEQKYRMGGETAAHIIAYAKTILLPDPELVAIRIELMKHDLELLDQVHAHVAALEEQERQLLPQTPYQILTRLKGLGAIQVASLAAAVGDPTTYACASQVFRRSGLVSGRNDSGSRQKKGKGKKIVKTGDVYLRRILTNLVISLGLHQPVLGRYYQKLNRSKPDGVARVATARKMTHILWAVVRDQRSQSLIFKEKETYM
ncbi:MAG TPA: IS110 family transposase [Anaerolineaceae bacterium]|nr:IS110 family transposase [Anaerolineaceae bacterium]